MSYLVLARKWRPQRFADLVGQDVVVRTLKNALSSKHIAHAYLMTGIRGVGKTTISRLMAMAVNCTQAQDGEPCGTCEACVSIAKGSNLDVQEMDAASHTGVDDIREILDGVRYPPVHLNTKVYIIDEAHMLSKSAFNALLKTLEEPPENVMFILATTESDKLPITVRSRCQRFDLRRLNIDEIADYLAYVLKQEGINASPEALQTIARAADGSVRDALSLTERVLAFSSQDISLDDVQQSLGLIGAEQTIALADAVLRGEAQTAVDILRQAREMGVAPAHLLRALSERLHDMACCKLDSGITPQGIGEHTLEWLRAQADCWSHQALDMRYQVLVHGLRDLMLVDEQRGAEMIVMRLAHLNTIAPSEKELPAPTFTQKKTLENVADKPKRVFEQQPAQNATQAPPTTSPRQTEQTEQTEAETQRKTPQPPTSWAEAIAQYHNINPAIAAHLEHVVCASFAADEVRLLLTPHQHACLDQQARQAFAAWLGKPVLWGNHEGQAGESLVAQQQREQQEAERQRWQTAEADPAVRLLKEKLGCRLINVRPPQQSAEDNPENHINS